jgi:hypothetical protein
VLAETNSKYRNFTRMLLNSKLWARPLGTEEPEWQFS